MLTSAGYWVTCQIRIRMAEILIGEAILWPALLDLVVGMTHVCFLGMLSIWLQQTNMASDCFHDSFQLWQTSGYFCRFTDVWRMTAVGLGIHCGHRLYRRFDIQICHIGFSRSCSRLRILLFWILFAWLSVVGLLIEVLGRSSAPPIGKEGCWISDLTEMELVSLAFWRRRLLFWLNAILISSFKNPLNSSESSDVPNTSFEVEGSIMTLQSRIYYCK